MHRAAKKTKSSGTMTENNDKQNMRYMTEEQWWYEAYGDPQNEMREQALPQSEVSDSQDSLHNGSQEYFETTENQGARDFVIPSNHESAYPMNTNSYFDHAEARPATTQPEKMFSNLGEQPGERNTTSTAERTAESKKQGSWPLQAKCAPVVKGNRTESRQGKTGVGARSSDPDDRVAEAVRTKAGKGSWFGGWF